MIEQISSFFTIETIYLWLNIGVIPFWLILIFFSNSKICSLLTTSIFPILIFSVVYSYLVYLFFTKDYDFLSNFNLYLSLEALQDLFTEKSFLILFWTHFLAINFFCGAWIVKDSQKLQLTKPFVFFPLIITYFVGPLGIFLYWIIRIFSAKKISLYD
tara:strand:+ start:56 stop:529 length:474 start_codon:yes stop_codon:yes gene_type:complete